MRASARQVWLNRRSGRSCRVLEVTAEGVVMYRYLSPEGEARATKFLSMERARFSKAFSLRKLANGTEPSQW